MNSLSALSSLSFVYPSVLPSTPNKTRLFPLNPRQSRKSHLYPFSLSFSSPQNPLSPFITAASSQTPSAIPIQEIIEKDWSFLDPTAPDTNLAVKTSRIISSAQIQPNSRILISLGTEYFIDRLIESSRSGPSDFQLLLVVHESLFVLATIKEKYDDGVRCWQGGIVEVPEKWAPFDAVFLCYLPGLDYPLNQIFGAVAYRCSEGARLVISFAQGREAVERHRQQHPDMVTSDLPDKVTLEKTAADHSFQVIDFADEPDFYLIVLKFCKPRNGRVET